MKLRNAKQLCDIAAAKGFGVPALNNNGGSYDVGRAIIEAAQELDSPLIIAEYEPNLEYRGYDWAGTVIKHLAADTTIPMCIALDHGRTPQSIARAVRAGFTHVMIDYADKPLAENVRGTQQIIDFVRPLGISVEEAKEFASQVDVDCLAVAVGTTHGIFKEQHGLDFKLMSQIHKAVKPPLVLHGTCGISMADISRCVKSGMTKINFGEGIRMDYIRYFNEFSSTLNHEHHVWRIARAAKDRLKEDIKTIIRAVGSEGKASEIR